ncbi:MAG: hypothetical protein MRY63_03630 [Neomegalonema sp.]|nr:hypothetical protein [Neomegalonema sp.]
MRPVVIGIATAIIAVGVIVFATEQFDEPGPAERIGQSIDDAANDAGNAIDDAGNAIDEAAQDTRRAVEDAAD